jgi:hypothetical protein
MRAAHRAGEAARALAGCEVTAHVLDAAEVAARLRASLDATGAGDRAAGELR